MNRIQRLLRSLGPAGAVANARRSCDELRLRDQYAAAIDRRFTPRPGDAAKIASRVA
ncbi:MAG: hypothetical protein NVSMB12_11570 [Acidimicrobiales bacterium]